MLVCFVLLIMSGVVCLYFVCAWMFLFWVWVIAGFVAADGCDLFVLGLGCLMRLLCCDWFNRLLV